jgi:hypothetical protein
MSKAGILKVLNNLKSYLKKMLYSNQGLLLTPANHVVIILKKNSAFLMANIALTGLLIRAAI